MAACFTQVIRQLVRGDRKQIGLQRAAFIEIGQTRQKANEGLLHDVFAGCPVVHAPVHESEQTAFITSDQVLPGARIALANLLNKETVVFGGHSPSLTKPPPKRNSAEVGSESYQCQQISS